jgi:hypothetical protein
MRSFHYVTDLEHCLLFDASAPRLVGTVKLFGNFFPWQVFSVTPSVVYLFSMML